MPIPVSPEYFQTLSRDYARQTGNSTANVFASFLPKITPSIKSGSVVHDNACGVGTVSFALLSALPTDAQPARIEATDFSEGMIAALKYQIEAGEPALQKITPQVLDSQSLNFPDNHFDISITNISVATFKDPVAGLREVHRTLKPGGVAVVSHWKRFTVADIIHQVQKNIRGPDAKLMFLPGPQYREDGYLRDRMAEVGLAGEQSIVQTIVKGEAVDGLREFMMGPFTASAREGWTEEETERWEGELDKAIEAEVKQWGGIMMEAWFILASKAG